MKLEEVSILTHDVVRLADFYKSLLEMDNGSNDMVHQTIIAEETMLTIFNDGQKHDRQNMCLVFTVYDIDKEYDRIQFLGAEIVEPPTVRPWGATNMSFKDPDGNIVYLRSFPNQ